MTVNSQRLLLAAAGAGGAAGEGLYVDEVFSTYIYDGNNGLNEIDNGIDLSGEGGLVWIKNRGLADRHSLVDTERGKTKHLSCNETNAERTRAFVQSFDSDGFTLNVQDNEVNSTPYSYASWTFRKAPGFFDVVTYTGNGTAGHTISHNLGSVPGAIIVKRRDTADDWAVWHRSLGATKYLQLNLADAEADLNTIWNDTEPTSTNFTVGVNGKTNTNGSTYVAYIFAHDDQSFGTGGDEAIIKCGSYTGAGANQQVDVGFEPQWLLIRGSSNGGDWSIYDSMRTGDNVLLAQSTGAETDVSSTKAIDILSDGFQLPSTEYGDLNASGRTYIYIAIRRPHKPPEAGTDVFAIDTSGGTSPTPPWFNSGFVTDFVLRKDVDSTGGAFAFSRLQGQVFMRTTSNAVETSNTNYTWDFMNGFSSLTSVDTDKYGYLFRRAAGFMDVVCWTGTSTSGSSSRALSHNLAATPGLIIGKRRSSLAGNWSVYSSVTGINNELELNANAAVAAATNMWKAAPTDSNFTVGYGLDGNTYTFVAYLFASLSGVSKIGSYSGTGSNVGVDCGFTAGARFVMIKRTDSTGDWYVYDSDRGIVGGNDPYWRANVEAAQVTNTDYIDPLNSGFTVTSSAPADLNASGGTYLFLAIA